jgi:hypothetical protein
MVLMMTLNKYSWTWRWRQKKTTQKTTQKKVKLTEWENIELESDKINQFYSVTFVA